MLTDKSVRQLNCNDGMRITICGSISFASKILEIRGKLIELGHEALLPASILDFSVKDSSDAEKLKKDREEYISKTKPRYTREHFNLIEKSDAILVVNEDKNGVKNYIGGATFSELMLAFHLKKKIFLLNPVPEDPRLSFIKDEVECTRPIILNGDIGLVR